MAFELIEFRTDDGVQTNGYINKCDKKTDKVLIQTHGMTGNCFKNREKTISKEVEKIGVDAICFNNRGSEIVKYIKYFEEKKELAGMAYENIEDSYYDIVGAIKYAVKLGYTKIYLQGHSLGSTKVVYTYNRMKKENNDLLKYIKGIVLLSLVDVANLLKKVTKKEYLDYANEKESKGQVLELMPDKTFFHPISIKTFLKYVKYNEDIDFAQYGNDDFEFETLNNIEVPLFMRWGNVREMIEREADDQVNFMNNKIKNANKDIDYIDGANHSYDNREEQLANQISNFIKKC